MYKAIIDNSATYLFCDTENYDIDNKKIMGMLINHENIIDLVNSIPISEFYVQANGERLKITKEQAIDWYNQIIKQQKSKKESKSK